MISKILYQNDSYINEFGTSMKKCIPYDDKYALILDETAFYPEGGGQPSDRGCINDYEVLDVIEENGEILHIVNQEISPGKVQCKIDWPRRFDYMQQHTGQHILSYCFLEIFGGTSDSFHIGMNNVSIEIDLKYFDQQMCNQVENKANEIIYRNLLVKAMIVNEEDLVKLPLRKHPSVKDNIRIVQIGDMDYSPCGGTHVKSTGEVGMIKIIRWEKLKSSYRFEFLCGKRALMDYRDKNISLLSLCSKFSVKNSDLNEAVERLTNENSSLLKELAKTRKMLVKYEAEELYNNIEAINKIKVIKSVFKDRKFDEIKALASEITSHEKTIALLGVINDTAQVVFSRSDDIDININSLLKAYVPIISGKGGGSPKTSQGGGNLTEKLDEMIERAYDMILASI